MYKYSIGKVYVHNTFSGTAWLINLEYMLTAEHCVKNITSGIAIIFPCNEVVEAFVVDSDRLLDVALLKLKKPQLFKSRLNLSTMNDLSLFSHWKAHGYPYITNHRFESGISITGRISNLEIEFDQSPVVQLYCNQGSHSLNLNTATLKGISGAPVMVGDNNNVIGLIRFAPLEFSERILVATRVDAILERFKSHLPDDLTSIKAKETINNCFFYEKKKNTYTEECSGGKAKTNKIYDVMDDFRIQKYSDYEKINSKDKANLNITIFNSMVLNSEYYVNELDDGQVNLKFDYEQIDQIFIDCCKQSINTFHINATLYAKHSFIAIPHIKYFSEHKFLIGESADYTKECISDRVIKILIKHRDLIERGRMSIMPELVDYIDDDFKETTVFNLNNLNVINVDLNDDYIKRSYLSYARLFKPVGLIVMNKPSDIGLSLDEMIDIIEKKEKEMYGYFQSHIKKLLYEKIDSDDTTHAFRYMLQAVDEGIQCLNAKFRLYQSKRCYFNRWNLMAFKLYAEDNRMSAYIKHTFENTTLSKLISFFPEKDAFPCEFRESPFFVPWLICHEGRKKMEIPNNRQRL